MSTFKKFISHQKRLVLPLVASGAASLATVGVIVGTASARHAAAGKHTGSVVARQSSSRLPFAVFTRAVAHTASVSGLRGAVLAAAGGGRETFVWHGARNEAGSPYRQTMKGDGEQICLISQGAPNASGVGQLISGTCRRASLISEKGIIDITETGANLSRRVTVLVPNGVEKVTFTDQSGTSYNVAVNNNVVTSDDQNLASPPATAVSFVLPNGAIERASMPAPPQPPQS